MNATRFLALLAVAGSCSACNGAGTASSGQPRQITDVHAAGLVTASTKLSSPCYSVVAPVASYAADNGCHLQLATQSLGPGTAPDVPYFSIEALTSGPGEGQQTLDQKAQTVLSGLKQAIQDQLARYPGHNGRVSKGPYDTAEGAFEGIKSVTVAGHPARQLTWGFSQSRPDQSVCTVGADGQTRCSHATVSESVDILVDVPRPGFVWDGKPADTILIKGHTQGYQSQAFRAALASTVLNF